MLIFYSQVKKLREATTYQFRIRASDERGGRGAWSEPVEGRTTLAPPPAPRVPDVVLTAPRGATVSWEPLDDATYLLQCARGKDSLFKQVRTIISLNNLYECKASYDRALTETLLQA